MFLDYLTGLEIKKFNNPNGLVYESEEHSCKEACQSVVAFVRNSETDRHADEMPNVRVQMQTLLR